MSDPRTKYSSCPLCNDLLLHFKGSEEEKCYGCGAKFNPQTNEVLARPPQKFKGTITPRSY